MSRKKSSKQASSATRRKRGAQQKTQRWLWLGLGALILLVIVALFLPRNSAPQEITVSQAYQKYQQGAFFLDVRTVEEWDQAYIPRSTLIPLDELGSRLDELPRDQEIVVVCRTGRRSKEGMTILRQAGFQLVSSMNGGLTAWQAAGYPLESLSP